MPCEAGRRRLPFAALLAANAISMVGNTMTQLAIPWFVLQSTGSAAKTGISGFFAVLPTAIAAFLGGAIVDALGYRRASILADVASGISVALIPLLHATVGLEFWQLLALVFLGALLDAPGATAREALLPQLARAAGVRPERANALSQGIQRFSTLAGPPLAGILVATLGATRVLLVDAATFAVSAVLIAAIGRVARNAAVSPGEPGGFLAGARFLYRSRLFATIAITVAITNFLDAPIFAVVLPAYANESLGSATALGFAIAAFGAGALTGVALFAAVGLRVPRRLLFVGGFASVALGVGALATGPSAFATAGILFAVGVAAGPINPLLMTVFQERIPEQIYGQALGTIFAVALSAAPFGILVVGFAIERFGVAQTIAGLATLYLGVAIAIFATPVLRELGSPPGASPASEP